MPALSVRWLGKQGLIHYVMGEKGEKLGTGDKTWYQKLGLRDAKRVAVLLIILCYGAGLFTALSMRRAVLVQISRCARRSIDKMPAALSTTVFD